MKNNFSQLIQPAALLFAGILAACAAMAADAPDPATPDRQPVNRPDRGNFQGRGGPGGANFPGGGGQGGPNRGNFQGRGGDQGGPGGMGLDEKQRELFREASQKDGDELRKLDEKLRAAQKELLRAVLAENYDEKLVREKAEAVGKIQTDITMLRAKALATVAPTLKLEQREQIENSRLNILTAGGGAFGGGMPGGGFGGGGFGGGPQGGGVGGRGFGGGGFGGQGNLPPGSETLGDASGQRGPRGGAGGGGPPQPQRPPQ